MTIRLSDFSRKLQMNTGTIWSPINLETTIVVTVKRFTFQKHWSTCTCFLVQLPCRMVVSTHKSTWNQITVHFTVLSTQRFNLFVSKRFGLEGWHVDFFVALLCLPEWATWKLASFVGHEVTAMRERELFKIQHLPGTKLNRYQKNFHKSNTRQNKQSPFHLNH